MARAGRVPGIRPKRTLIENASRVLDVRLDEVLSWRGALDDATLVSDLHDMRIAAKRLRYALEMFSICYENSKSVLKDLTDIQEDLGDIHDLDVMADVLRGRLAAIDAPLEAQATQIMAGDGTPGEKTRALRRLLSAHGREVRRLGLIGLLGDKIVERHRRYQRFCEKWGGGRLDSLAGAIHEFTRPHPELLSAHSTNGHMSSEEDGIPDSTTLTTGG